MVSWGPRLFLFLSRARVPLSIFFANEKGDRRLRASVQENTGIECRGAETQRVKTENDTYEDTTISHSSVLFSILLGIQPFFEHASCLGVTFSLFP